MEPISEITEIELGADELVMYVRVREAKEPEYIESLLGDFASDKVSVEKSIAHGIVTVRVFTSDARRGVLR